MSVNELSIKNNKKEKANKEVKMKNRQSFAITTEILSWKLM